jgi:hypothetical protein
MNFIKSLPVVIFTDLEYVPYLINNLKNFCANKIIE